MKAANLVCICAVVGMVTSVTNFASSVSRNMDRLSLDSGHLQRQEETRRHRPQGLSSGLHQGLTGFGLSLLGMTISSHIHHQSVSQCYPPSPPITHSTRHVLIKQSEHSMQEFEKHINCQCCGTTNSITVSVVVLLTR